MKQIRYFIFSILLCGLTHLQAVDYNTDIGPIIGSNATASCNLCHGTTGWTYAEIVNMPSGTGMNYITPNDLSNSYLYLKITGSAGISGDRMPQNNQTYFDNNPNELQLIIDWISEGALETPGLEISKSNTIPNNIILNPVYPNPFNPSATISWEQPGAENIHISIFNLRGELSDKFSLKNNQPGFNTFDWHPAGLPTGVYLIRLTGETFTVTQKAIYLK